MANLNRIILVGTLTDDPELRYTVEGLPITKFSLAVDRYRGANNPKETDFINIVAWRKLAEVCGQYLKKGRLVLVEGRIQVRSYQTDAGIKKWSTEVIARNMQMLDAQQKEEAVGQTKVIAQPGSQNIENDIPGSADIPEGEDNAETDLPF